jgi:hypothetical protein
LVKPANILSKRSDEGLNKIGEVVEEERRYLNRVSLAFEITNAIRACNNLFTRLTDAPTLFREDIQIISALHQPCNNEIDFNVKLGALAGLFEVDLMPWKSLIPDLDPNIRRANSLLFRWFDIEKIPYDRSRLEIWNNVQDLRNSSFPYHQTDQRWVKVAEQFDQKFPINYPQYYEIILVKFLDSLKILQTILNFALYRDT